MGVGGNSTEAITVVANVISTLSVALSLRGVLTTKSISLQSLWEKGSCKMYLLLNSIAENTQYWVLQFCFIRHP